MGSHSSKHATPPQKNGPKTKPPKKTHARHSGHEFIYGGRPSLAANKGKGAWVRPRQKKGGGKKTRGDAEAGGEGGDAWGNGEDGDDGGG